jgi:uncharacterized membrane protein (DUF106 family)
MRGDKGMNWSAVGLSVGIVFLFIAIPLLITRVYAIVDSEMMGFWKDSKGFSWLIGFLTIIVISIIGTVIYGVSIGLYSFSKDVLKPDKTVKEVKREEPKEVEKLKNEVEKLKNEEEDFKDIGEEFK